MQRRWLATTTTVLIVSAAAAGCGSSDDTLEPRAAGPAVPAAATADESAQYANPMRSSVSKEQKARRGKDATAACRDQAVKTFVESMNAAGNARLLGAYYADGPGLAAWGAELTGGQAALDPEFQWADELHALCWFSGDFLAPGIDGQESPATHIVIDSRLTPEPALTVAASAQGPIAVFPPAMPGKAHPAAARAAEVSHAQPKGVREAPAPPDRTAELEAELENRKKEPS